MSSLKEKFNNLNKTHIYFLHNSVECEKIADEYAIGFLNYVKNYELESGNVICHDERESKELLEIFKKEKGL